MPEIAVMIPTFNEAETIGYVLSTIPRILLGYPVCIVIADDCSTDNTAEIAQRYTSHVLTSPSNTGVGASTKRALAFIAESLSVKYVIKFDGDGQHNTEFLPAIVERLEEGADLVTCSRFHGLSDQTHTPTDRILLNMIFTEMVRKITGWHLTDVRTGYMGFRFEHAVHLSKELIVARYGIPMEIILRIWHLNPDAVTVEIPHPALYGPNISEKLATKYSTETVSVKANRLQVAYEALLTVVEDLRIPHEKILEMNGFATEAVPVSV